MARSSSNTFSRLYKYQYVVRRVIEIATILGSCWTNVLEDLIKMRTTKLNQLEAIGILLITVFALGVFGASP